MVSFSCEEKNMIEGIGSIVRYMGKNWINGCVETPAVFGVRKDTEAENSLCNDSEEKKAFQQLLEEAKKKEN